jgi:Na+/H+ antiporter NhaD/arsenite permease-like protein
MSYEAVSSGSNKPVLFGIGLILLLYILGAFVGWPQKATQLASQASHGDQQQTNEKPSQAAPQANHSATGSLVEALHPPLLMILPFALLLLSIAILPLIPWTSHWWESNLHKFYAAAGLGILTLLYYLFFHEMAVELDWPVSSHVTHSPEGPNFAVMLAVVVNAMMAEYLPFIILLFTLYTISGSIRIEGDLVARPSTNTIFLAVGALLASFIGTTGAAMLLIRPLLETNQERKHVVHTIVLFIFIVCNCGGCLLPLGDPPLFLGYLFGVPFLWTFSLWPAWLFVNVSLLVLYYVWDRFWYYPRETSQDVVLDKTQVRGLKISGLWPNALLLIGVVLSVALLDPSKPLPGTNWHPWMYLREMAQLGLVGLSLLLGSDSVRRANNFNFGAILEVAALFFGIFIAMQPPLQILHVRGPSLGLHTPEHFFWATGTLSSVLDNAPTYVVYYATAKTLGGQNLVPAGNGVEAVLLAAVSLGAVFMGSMTYIGNGPNFMVKAIAEKSGVRMPSFFGYMVYSFVILLPLFFVVTKFILPRIL